MKNPKITAVMSVYNAEKYLRESIDSILNQTFEDFEFLIINDGSTDKTAEILRSYSDTRIKIINNEKNIGLTRSLNKGLGLARGEYIARMDADDLSMPERFEVQIRFLNENRNVGLVGSSFFVIDDRDVALNISKVPLGNDEIRERLLKKNAFGHGSIMVQRECLDSVGLYREEFAFAQDYDLYLRIAEKYDLANINEPLYKWRLSPGQISIENKLIQDRYAEFARELAKQRRQSGSDILQTASTQEKEKILNDMHQKVGSDVELPEDYYRSKVFYGCGDYKNAASFLVKVFPRGFFSLSVLILMAKIILKSIKSFFKKECKKCQK